MRPIKEKLTFDLRKTFIHYIMSCSELFILY